MEESINTPELLLLRPSGMLCNVLLTTSKKDNFAQEIYKQLCSYAGKEALKLGELVVHLEQSMEKQTRISCTS